MAANYLPRPAYLAERERADLAARKAEQEAKRDPGTEQAVVAYINHRRDGGGMKWEEFRRQWMTDTPKEGE